MHLPWILRLRAVQNESDCNEVLEGLSRSTSFAVTFAQLPRRLMVVMRRYAKIQLTVRLHTCWDVRNLRSVLLSRLLVASDELQNQHVITSSLATPTWNIVHPGKPCLSYLLDESVSRFSRPSPHNGDWGLIQGEPRARTKDAITSTSGVTASRYLQQGHGWLNPS
ncbi:uncharacterized protein EV420DRAFT_1087309 [Desarmillaria tabescens]|uniref:Uncharacterized protein n=1 Tax=Armillaria tabescens TaxID=1929756 RepID=A0AA39MNY9_ARMTA|nr:uncharacterized protein EV420DRAFT_1087309 [Desarmillaria tabescens]KAK0441736.1 hypothetical protein EV420DRAFT_1087309 [Desarmillaria tabescens]